MPFIMLNEREKTRIRQFFAELRNVCGFLYTAPDGSKQYFIKIDEALLEGELTGSLLATVNTGNEQNPFKETTYPINGITDGRLLNFYTNIDGKSKKLDGHLKTVSPVFIYRYGTAMKNCFLKRYRRRICTKIRRI